jgi:predicted  nucleic acid-binding Zn-ribbon protein
MREELIQLVTLQKFDTQILEIDDHLIGLQKDIDQAEARLEVARQQVAKKEDGLKEVQSQSRAIDSNISESGSRYKEYSYQLMSMKDEKSYDTMKLQMEELKSSTEEQETRGLELLESIEATEKKLSIYRQKISDEELRVEGLKNQLKEQTDSRAEDRSTLVKKRDGYLSSINPTLKAQYQRLLQLPDRQAIAQVNLSDRSCLKCYSTLTRENIETIKMMKQVVNCNRCGRILYVPALLGQADPE